MDHIRSNKALSRIDGGGPADLAMLSPVEALV
jgi:hypothetical protein